MRERETAGVPVRGISIAQWHALAQEGAALGVKIRLDGDSMRPLIRRNRDEVTIQPLTRPLKRGDVILFRNAAGQHVVHRVRKLGEGRVQTLGDNCWNPDPWIPAEQALGLAVCVKRDGRTIRLDGAPGRGIGRVWMAFRPMRNLFRRALYWAVRTIRRVFPKRR